MLQPAPLEIRPAHFERERPALKVISPSSLTKFDQPDIPAQESAQAHQPCPPHVWGTLVHRILAHRAGSGTPPSPEQAGAFLRREGVDAENAVGIARRALAEVQLCLEDPWLRSFYDLPPGKRKVEWAVESVHEKGVIYSGIVDLAAEFDGKWKLVDFKTSRPEEGETTGEFRRRETDLYRPQLRAYREMWAKLTGTAEAEIEVFLYWTALREWEQVRA